MEKGKPTFAIGGALDLGTNGFCKVLGRVYSLDRVVALAP